LAATAAGSTKTAVYRVGGLKGDHCRDRIEHTLSHLGGVAGVNVDLGAKEVKVAYDPAVILKRRCSPWVIPSRIRQMGVRFSPPGRQLTRRFRRQPPPDRDWDSRDFADEEEYSRY